MIPIRHLATLLMSFQLVSGCGHDMASDLEGSGPEGEERQRMERLEHEVIASGAYGAAAQREVSGVPSGDPMIVVATTRRDLETLWARHIGEGTPPDVDLDRRMAIFLIVPVRPTGGYAVIPERVELSERDVVVHARLKEPGPDVMTTQALTAPYAVLSVERPDRVESVEWTSDGKRIAREQLDAR